MSIAKWLKHLLFSEKAEKIEKYQEVLKAEEDALRRIRNIAEIADSIHQVVLNRLEKVTRRSTRRSQGDPYSTAEEEYESLMNQYGIQPPYGRHV